ncbi:hypothetical protein [Kaistella palustris]|uniref:hypothetical protein n=1 Tax=Kaistella palustris TaxID=493376 RepID=UPI000487BA7A|nr:hypothetical protein [Kaistella palustris]
MTVPIIIVVAILLFVIILPSKSSKDKIMDDESKINDLNNQYFLKLIERERNPQAKDILKKAKLLFDNGESYHAFEFMTHVGVPKEIAYSKDSAKINNYLGFTDEKARDLYTAYFLEVSKRDSLANDKIWIEEDAFDKHKIILKENEVLFSDFFYSIYYLEEKTVRRNINYSGVRVNYGPLRMGNLSYSANDVKDLVPIGIGQVYITNKRLIFKDNQNTTKEITLKSIVDYYLYKDAVLICRNNRKNVLLKSSAFQNYSQPENDSVVLLTDFPIQFINLISRIANKTYSMNLNEHKFQ